MAEDVSLVLAFDLSAFRRLADPEAAVDDARRWTEAVGVVSDRPAHVVSKFLRDEYVDQDFEPGPESAGEALAHVREHYDVGRYAYVGTGDDHRRTAETRDWEYLDVAEAADAAGWALEEASPASGSTRMETATDDWP